jgi:hypothetical protein
MALEDIALTCAEKVSLESIETPRRFNEHWDIRVVVESITREED